MPPFIEIQGLSKSYGDQRVIDRLDLAIPAGEIVVFQGPSGIGKSTFLRCLNYLEPFQEGRIRVGDVEVHAAMDEKRDHKTILALREQLGFVFQFFHLFPHLTVLENLTIGPVKVLREPVEKAREEGLNLLKRIGLTEKAQAYPAALSGGQQQRIAIARALAMHPRGILFDEPTSSLDPAMKGEIIRVIEDFADESLTLLIVTHEPGFVEKMADRIITLGPGCFIQADSPVKKSFR